MWGSVTYSKEHSNSNTRPIKKPMNSSVKKKEHDEYSYSPVEEPKVLD